MSEYIWFLLVFPLFQLILHPGTFFCRNLCPNMSKQQLMTHNCEHHKNGAISSKRRLLLHLLLCVCLTYIQSLTSSPPTRWLQLTTALRNIWWTAVLLLRFMTLNSHWVQNFASWRILGNAFKALPSIGLKMTNCFSHYFFFLIILIFPNGFIMKWAWSFLTADRLKFSPSSAASFKATLL